MDHDAFGKEFICTASTSQWKHKLDNFDNLARLIVRLSNVPRGYQQRRRRRTNTFGHSLGNSPSPALGRCAPAAPAAPPPFPSPANAAKKGT
eukprot:2811750-Pyramimonas_sp.AAC.1